MGKAILPETIREDIKELFQKGYTREAVHKFIGTEAKNYVVSDEQLKRCIVRIEQVVPGIPNMRIDYPNPPKSKQFDPRPYSKFLAGLTKRTPLREIENIGTAVAKGILREHEGFRNIKYGPDVAGTPFDLFGFKDKNPYLIELKASLNNFNYPGEIQKKRMQELLRNIKGLHIALIQLKLKRADYRIFYDTQMDFLFHGSKMPLGPIENWIRKYL